MKPTSAVAASTAEASPTLVWLTPEGGVATLADGKNSSSDSCRLSLTRGTSALAVTNSVEQATPESNTPIGLLFDILSTLSLLISSLYIILIKGVEALLLHLFQM